MFLCLLNPPASLPAEEFQTPAPRGGVPLTNLLGSLMREAPSFKPLRLGAVFLCPHNTNISPVHLKVSNPCASGRCSSARPDCPGQGRWHAVSNPCASGRCSSGWHEYLLQECRRVSNPCASGRCSSVYATIQIVLAAWAFQTPAPRGGVPLPGEVLQPRPGGQRFKPLRLGAVFLWDPYTLRETQFSLVSNPCASGRCSSEDIFRRGAVRGRKFQTPAPRGGVPLTGKH